MSCVRLCRFLLVVAANLHDQFEDDTKSVCEILSTLWYYFFYEFTMKRLHCRMATQYDATKLECFLNQRHTLI